jgi:hypothetical protein
MKRLFIIFLSAFLFFAVERLCHKATDGFAMVNVYAPRGENQKWHREGEIPRHLLKQTFTYFDSGSQSYVFLSEDGTTVLKLFKFQHMRTPPVLNFLPDVGALRRKREKKRAVLEKTFDSLCLAYDEMKEETGLITLHLAKTSNLKQSITIIDKIGKTHLIDLDQVEFLLQRKGVLAYEAINRWMTQENQEAAENAVRSLLRLAESRCQKGIFDKDPDFSTNFGYIDTTPFQIDFGRLSPSAQEKQLEVYGPEMIRITRAFESWIAENHPILLDSFVEELNEIVCQ